MLKEIVPIIQNESPFYKRWYHSTDGSLFLWEKDGAIESFQFCFSDFQGEKCFSWKKGGIVAMYSLTDKLSHQGTIGLEGQGIMISIEDYDVAFIIECFTDLSGQIPSGTREFIITVLTQYHNNKTNDSYLL